MSKGKLKDDSIMRVTAPKKHLVEALARCQGVADKKSTMPALANVLLDATAERLVYGATDLYLAVSGTVDGAEVSKAGSIAVNADDLYKRAKMMPDGPIELSASDGYSLTVKSVATNRRYTLRGMPGADFPVLPQPDDKAVACEIPARTLSALIARVIYAISTDETRAALNSMQLRINGTAATVAATDGHRASRATLKLNGGADLGEMLVSQKATGELKRLLDVAKDDDAVKVERDDANVYVTLGGVRLSCKLVAAEFPPLDSVIPKRSDHTATIGRAALAEILRAVSIAASDRTGGVRLDFANGTLKVSAESPETGDGTDTIAIEYDGGEQAIGLNARYGIETLDALSADEVTVAFGGDLEPLVVREVGNDDFVGVLMPMRI